MSLLIHRAERADHLVHALGALLSRPLPDPFTTEIVSVPTPGVERWLSQRLAARLGTRPGGSDGVCAGVDFCSPQRLVGRALAATDATRGRGRPLAARPGGLAAAAGDRRVPRPAVGPTALVPPRRPVGSALVRRPAPGRAVRRVRGQPAGHAARLVGAPRRRPGRAAARPRPGLAGRAVAPAAGGHRRPGARRAGGRRRPGAPRAARSWPTCPPGSRCSAPPGWSPTT